MKAGQRGGVTRLEGLSAYSRDHLMTDRDGVSPGLTDSLGVSPETALLHGVVVRGHLPALPQLTYEVNTFAAHVSRGSQGSNRESTVAVLNAMRDTDEIE